MMFFLRKNHKTCWVFVVMFFCITHVALAQEVDENQDMVTTQRFKILLVPGHNNESPGAWYNDVREENVVLLLGEKMKEEFSKDPRVSVVLARNRDGYIPELAKYYKDSEKTIVSFVETAKKKMKYILEAAGDKAMNEQAPHNDASKEVAYRLYATNKWTDEQDFDLVIHIHFNDYYPRPSKSIGKYDGYSIYTPGKFLSNEKTTRPIAQSVGRRLDSVLYQSNIGLDREYADIFGVIPDNKLISLGANDTLETPSILIEYGFIYEPILSDKLIHTSLESMAYATVLGVRDFLSGAASTPSVRYVWEDGKIPFRDRKSEVLMLQFALHSLGMYPPPDQLRSQCAMDGVFGSCTKKAVQVFQRTHGLTKDGVVGDGVQETLNKLFASELLN